MPKWETKTYLRITENKSTYQSLHICISTHMNVYNVWIQKYAQYGYNKKVKKRTLWASNGVPLASWWYHLPWHPLLSACVQSVPSGTESRPGRRSSQSGSYHWQPSRVWHLGNGPSYRKIPWSRQRRWLHPCTWWRRRRFRWWLDIASGLLVCLMPAPLWPGSCSIRMGSAHRTRMVEHWCREMVKVQPFYEEKVGFKKNKNVNFKIY